MDKLSKHAHFILQKWLFTTKIVAEAFVSDKYPVFLSNFWKEMSQLQGTKINMSTSYHPQTNGQIEVVNKSLEIYLKCFTLEYNTLIIPLHKLLLLKQYMAGHHHFLFITKREKLW